LSLHGKTIKPTLLTPKLKETAREDFYGSSKERHKYMESGEQ